jgi:hypothetical protein
MLNIGLYGFSIGLIGSAKYGSKQSTDIDGCCLSAEDMREKKTLPYYNPARGARRLTPLGCIIPSFSGTKNLDSHVPETTPLSGTVKGLAHSGKCWFLSAFAARRKRKPLLKQQTTKKNYYKIKFFLKWFIHLIKNINSTELPNLRGERESAGKDVKKIEKICLG